MFVQQHTAPSDTSIPSAETIAYTYRKPWPTRDWGSRTVRNRDNSLLVFSKKYRTRHWAAERNRSSVPLRGCTPPSRRKRNKKNWLHSALYDIMHIYVYVLPLVKFMGGCSVAGGRRKMECYFPFWKRGVSFSRRGQEIASWVVDVLTMNVICGGGSCVVRHAALWGRRLCTLGFYFRWENYSRNARKRQKPLQFEV